MYWHLNASDESLALPFPIVGSEAALSFIKSWVDSLEDKDIKREMPEEGDGSHGFGFIAHQDGMCNYEIIRFKPVLLYYSK